MPSPVRRVVHCANLSKPRSYPGGQVGRKSLGILSVVNTPVDRVPAASNTAAGANLGAPSKLFNRRPNQVADILIADSHTPQVQTRGLSAKGTASIRAQNAPTEVVNVPDSVVGVHPVGERDTVARPGRAFAGFILKRGCAAEVLALEEVRGVLGVERDAFANRIRRPRRRVAVGKHRNRERVLLGEIAKGGDPEFLGSLLIGDGGTRERRNVSILFLDVGRYLDNIEEDRSGKGFTHHATPEMRAAAMTANWVPAMNFIVTDESAVVKTGF